MEERGKGMSGLKVMDVFVLCGALVTLGWGGVKYNIII
jgi:hypothetical protein